MFGQFRAALDIDKSIDILDHVHSLPPVEQEAAFAKIRAIESVRAFPLLLFKQADSPLLIS
jgi:hypothetical protein